VRAVLRDADGRVEAVCHDMAFLARRIGARPVERVDVWPNRAGLDACQVGIGLADGSSTIFDLPLAAAKAPWVLNRHGRAAGWPEPRVHTLDPAQFTPERRKDHA
jgi:hypothetical protein